MLPADMWDLLLAANIYGMDVPDQCPDNSALGKEECETVLATIKDSLTKLEKYSTVQYTAQYCNEFPLQAAPTASQ
eukprot:g43950.t1